MIIIITIFNLLSKIPAKYLFCVSKIIAWTLNKLQIIPIHRLINKQIHKCFPDIDKNKVLQIKQKHINYLCEYVAEFIKFRSLNSDEVKEKIRYKNIDLLENLISENRYVCCYCAHMIGYEFFVGLPLWINERYGMCCFYQSQSTKPTNKLEEWVKSSRSKFGARLISSASPLREIVQLKNEIENKNSKYNGFIIGSLAELKPRKHSASTRVRFLGHKTQILVGTERIGRMLNAAFVYAHIKRINQGKYEVELVELKPVDVETNKYAYTHAFVSEMEKNIRNHPEMWMLWSTQRI